MVKFKAHISEVQKCMMQLRVVSLCMSPKNDSFMSGALDHTVRLWDLRTNVCQVRLPLWVVGCPESYFFDVFLL